MLNVNIPPHIEDELQLEADLSGRTRDEVAAEILSAHFEDVSLPLSAFTEAQLARFKESVEQVKRGDVVHEEEVNAFSRTGSKRSKHVEPNRPVSIRQARS